MNSHSSRPRPIPENFAEDARPGADAQVYCKGCGTALTGQARHQQGRAKVTSMMCEPCQEKHGHALMPAPGEPSYCFRCGGEDVIVVERTFAPVTHHLCPRCVPERLARYRASDFKTPLQNRPV